MSAPSLRIPALPRPLRRSSKIAVAAAAALLQITLVLHAAPARAAAAEEETVQETALAGTQEPAPEEDAASTDEGPQEPKELKALRTRTSRTFTTPEGGRAAEVFPGSIHFQDASGTWRPIDNTLVASTRLPYTLQNAANAYRLLLPPDLLAAPVRIEAGDRWLSFSLRGTAPAPASVSGAGAVYPRALPGVDVRYRAGNDLVKETFVLRDAASTRELSFTLALSEGLALREDGAGGIDVVGAGGEVAFRLAPPYIEDAAGAEGKASFSLSEENGEAVLALVLDEAWLDAPERVWPVAVDPTVVAVSPPGKDCYIQNLTQATTSLCDRARIRVGYDGSEKRRGLLRFAMPPVPQGAEIVSADLALFVAETTSARSHLIDLHRLTQSWTNAATWRTYNGTGEWASRGGDFAAHVYASASFSGATGWSHFFPTQLVRQWVAGTYPNHGLLLKQRTEGVNNVISFVSSEAANTARWPSLTITYNQPPAASPASPSGGELAHTTTMEWDFTDGDGDPQDAYRLQLDDASDFASPVLDTGVVAGSDPRHTHDLTLEADAPYWWRVQVSDGTSWSGWSGAADFRTPNEDEALLGERDFYKLESQRLNDRMHLHANVATGNLVVHAEDLNITGTGLDLKVERYFNGLSGRSSDFGPGWVMGTGADVRLEPQGDGDVIYQGPSGYRVRFTQDRPGGGFTTPPGLKADLEKNGDGSYTIELHSKEELHFDPQGVLQRHEDKNDNAIRFTYNTDGTLAQITDTRGRATTFAYSGGRLASMTDVAGARTTTYGYDAQGRLASVSDPLTTNNPTTFGYDASGRLSSITDPRGNESTLSYDAQGRARFITRVTDKQTGTGPTTEFQYGVADELCPTGIDTITKVLDPEGNPTTYCVDGRGRVEEVIDAKRSETKNAYDSRHNVESFTDAGATSPAIFSWDAGDNLTQIGLPTGGQASMDYDDRANSHFPTSLWDFQSSKGNDPATWVYDYDGNGNLIEAHNPGENVTFQYCYTAKGLLERVAQPPLDGVPLDEDVNGSPCTSEPQGNDILLSYNADGELTTIDPPGPRGTLTFTYDAVSRVKTMTDGAGRTQTYTYDDLDRLTKIDYAEAAGGGGLLSAATTTETVGPKNWISYSYDPNGNLTSRTDEIGTTNFTYDELNRMLKQTPPSQSEGVTYAYDDVGNMTNMNDDGGTTAYAYDVVNLVDTITDPQGRVIDLEHTKNYLRDLITLPSGVQIDMEWDGSRRLDTMEARSASGQVLVSRDYDYRNAAGGDTMLRWRETDEAGVATDYDYDTLARLTGAATPGEPSFTYAYDANSNLTQETTGGVTTRFDYAPDNALLCRHTAPSCDPAAPGTVEFTYDGAGALSSTSEGLQIAYNIKGQTVQVTPPGGTAIDMAYYDADQTRRASAGDMRFGYSQLGLTAQGPSAGVSHTTYFLRTPEGDLLSHREKGPDGSWVPHYYIPDALGSVIGVIDQDGQLVATRDYEPYGELASQTGQGGITPFGFASGYQDEQIGWIKFGTRYHEPSQMLRWTQVDPERGSVENPLSLNPYLYVQGNPVNLTDPSGRVHESFECRFAWWMSAIMLTTSVVAIFLGPLTGPASLIVAGITGVFGLIATVARLKMGCHLPHE